MAVATLSQYDKVLKIFYIGPIRDQLNNTTYLWNKLEKNEENVTGKSITIPLLITENQGVGARADNGTLPSAGSVEHIETIVPTRYNYGRVQVTGPTIAATKNDRGAFVRVVDHEINRMTINMRKELNRQMFGTAEGSLTDVAASGGGAVTTITVDTTKYIYKGMYIDIVDEGTTTVITNGAALSVLTVPTSTTFTIANTNLSTMVADDEIYRSDSTSTVSTPSSSQDKEMMGLKGLVDDSTYVTTLQSVNRSNYPVWKAATFTNDDNGGTNRAITLDLLQELTDYPEKESGRKIDMYLTTYEIRRKLIDILVADKRFMGERTLKLDGGWTSLEFNGLPFKEEKDGVDNTIFALTSESMKMYRMSDFDWMDKDGAILSRVSGKDAYEATLYLYAELGIEQTNCNAFLRDISQ